MIFPLFIYIIYLSRSMLTPFLLAFFLAYAINPVVEFLQKKGATREYAILTVYFGLGIIAAFILGIIIPRLIRDLTQVIQELPLLMDEFKKIEHLFGRFSSNWELPSNLKFLTSEFTLRIEVLLRRLMIDIAEGAVKFFSQSIYLMLVPLLSYYISRDYPLMKQEVYQWLLKYFGHHWTRTFIKLDSVLRLYIRGQLLVTLIVGALISIGLALLGLEVAFFLGMLAGIFNLIPYFGPILGALPAIVFGLLKSPWQAFYVIVLFSLVNQLEVLFLAPRIIGGHLGLHPLFVVYLVLIGGKVFGLWGMVFVVPLGALLQIILKSIYEICFGLVNDEALLDE